MKIAIEHDNGEVTTFGNVEDARFNYHRGRLESVDFTPHADDDGAQYVNFTGDNARNGLAELFDLGGVKPGRRIPKSDIRKGDLIRMVDHGKPADGERDYKMLEYVAAEDGDGGYQFNAGEKFYLIDRPKVELPTAPGSVVSVRLDGCGVQRITLGNDGMWRGRDVSADAAMVNDYAEILEVIA